MQCPKCRHENPNDAQRCASCGGLLNTAIVGEPSSKAKFIAMTICAAVLAGLASVLVALVKPTLAFVAAVCSFFSAIAALRKNWGKGKFWGKSIGAAVLVLSSVQIIVLSYWRVDAAPIPNDYIIDDIKSAGPRYPQTYNLLLSLDDTDKNLNDAPAIGLSSEDIKKIDEINTIFKEADLQLISERVVQLEQEILSVWGKAKKGRDILDKLDSFPEIADLTEPNLYPDVDFARNLRRLVFLYRSYICLETCRDNHEAAVAELVKMDSVLKKLSLNARSVIMRLVCIACLTVDIETANFVINDAETPLKALSGVTKHVAPISEEYTSLEDTMRFEYLCWKRKLTEISNEPRLKYSSFSPLKLNSTLRLFRNFIDKLIAAEDPALQADEFRVWPSIYPSLEVSIVPDSNLPRYYRLYNPAGSRMIELVTPALEKVIEIRTKLQVHSDLLQIVLDQRRGKEVSLKARAYSDEYVVDVENRKIFSPGPDGKPGTKDDIKLPINPEVLGWSAATGS